MSSQPLRSETQHIPGSSSAPIVRNGGLVPILTPLDNEILERLGGPDFDMLYNKMENSFKTDMKNLLKKTSSIFGSKPLAPHLRDNKKDNIGHIIQENAVLSAACADTFRKLLELGAYDEAKEWTLLQIKLAASLGTDGSLIRVYERDRNMPHALSVINAAAVIRPIMKEEFKIVRANGVVHYNTKRFFRNPTYARSFSDSNGRRYGINDRSFYNQAYQSGLENGLNARRLFFRVRGEATTTGPTLSTKRVPARIPV
jgi:hypothetical protein